MRVGHIKARHFHNPISSLILSSYKLLILISVFIGIHIIYCYFCIVIWLLHLIVPVGGHCHGRTPSKIVGYFLNTTLNCVYSWLAIFDKSVLEGNRNLLSTSD